MKPEPHSFPLGNNLTLRYAPGSIFDTHHHRWALQDNRTQKLLSVMDTGDTGEIRRMETSPRQRRKGYATQLFNVATTYSGHIGVPAPQHSDERTKSGEAWATHLGAKPASNIISSRQFGYAWDMPIPED